MATEFDSIQRRIDVGGQNSYQHHDEKDAGEFCETRNPNADRAEELEYSSEVNELDSIWDRGW